MWRENFDLVRDVMVPESFHANLASFYAKAETA
jgi:hypothetical protein